MKKAVLLVTASLLGSAPLLAQFEGVFEMKMTTQGMNGTGKVHVAKAGVRTEVSIANPQMPMSFTMLVKSSNPDVVYRINDAAKTYTEIDTKAMREKAQAGQEETYTVKTLGSETVLGYPAKHVMATGARGTEMEMWTTRDIFGSSALWEAMNRRGGGSGALTRALKEAGADGFVLKMITREGGKPTSTSEVVKAEKRAVNPALLEIPAGYKKEEGMMGGMVTKSDLPPEASKQLEEQMKNLTPEQREMIEKMMKGQGQPPKK